MNILFTSHIFLFMAGYRNLQTSVCYILTFDPAQNAIQGDAPEGSDIFQWQLGEEIAWAEIG